MDVVMRIFKVACTFMKKYHNLLLFVLMLSLSSCTSISDKTLDARQKIIPIDTSKKNQPITPIIPSNVNSNFQTFLEYFNKDSIFQISRIAFPLKVKEANSDIDFDLRERIIQKADFRKMDFTYDKSKKNKQVDNYEQNIKVEGNKAVIEIRGIENGIIADYYFIKKNGKWTLLTWINSST